MVDVNALRELERELRHAKQALGVHPWGPRGRLILDMIAELTVPPRHSCSTCIQLVS